MTAFGTVEQAPVRLRPALTYLVAIGGLAFSLTILWLSMRAVMGIGGFCASGGPYVPAVECPDVVIALTPLSIFGLFIFGGFAWWGAAGLHGPWLGLIALGWPALFLSLGWNFLEFGIWPPGGNDGKLVWSWIICGVVFVLMGGLPLAGVIWGVREAGPGTRAYAGGRVVVQRAPNTLSSPAPSRSFAGYAAARTDPGADLATRLERLASLHRSGALTDAEFDAAKRATIDTEEG